MLKYISGMIINKMDHEKDSKIENIAIEFNSAEFDFDQSQVDEVFEKTKGCADKMSICAAS